MSSLRSWFSHQRCISTTVAGMCTWEADLFAAVEFSIMSACNSKIGNGWGVRDAVSLHGIVPVRRTLPWSFELEGCPAAASSMCCCSLPASPSFGSLLPVLLDLSVARLNCPVPTPLETQPSSFEEETGVAVDGVQPHYAKGGFDTPLQPPGTRRSAYSSGADVLH
eukprot:TRINITY_DN95233_c0_g1_i1.p1 TRINITY_DN95233_c0_g1~~TRINITY_DN95233_c0_g1_i1.p1  ORF type:complete len:166 (+),score=5.90 TRINITY_DN95233_c0_g1_i1:48-545(+)